MMRILDAVRKAMEYLEKAGIDDAPSDAELMVLHEAGIDRLEAFRDNPEASPALLSKIRRRLRQRASGRPVQYITGSVDFWGLEIKVGRGVLIPRPETELLAEAAVLELKKKSAADLSILDLCTGSGCLALALAKEFPKSSVTASDISPSALRYAKKNAATNGIENVRFLEGSLFDPLPEGESFDLVISNPPYIVSSDLPGLQREIRDWEPVSALDGGEDGLDFYRAIVAGAPDKLRKDGLLMLELGYGQSGDVSALARENGFTDVGILKDFSGIDRMLVARAGANR